MNRDDNTANLIRHLKKYIPIDPADESTILTYFQAKTFIKKENLIVQNSRCNYHFFVLKGCLRMFYTNDKGIEQTIQFAIENWWITDYLAFQQQSGTEFTIQAIELTDVLQISYTGQERLFENFPQLERYFRLVYQRAYAAAQLRTKYLYDFSREEFYHHFYDHFPEFARRVPQHILASYLNMSPEYLSEIKKKSRT